jgi:polyisoprenoid-binding protein YceI
MRRKIACAGMALLLAASPVLGDRSVAAPSKFVLAPGSVQVRFRAYGLGLMPIDGQFTRFHGTLTLDGANPAACTLMLEAETASLDMGSRLMTEDAQGSDLLDVAHFPDFRIEGSCDGNRIQATLLLHGVSRPIILDVTRAHGTWTASGLMRRAEWGMGARPMLAGPEVRISMIAGIPPGFGE